MDRGTDLSPTSNRDHEETFSIITAIQLEEAAWDRCRSCRNFCRRRHCLQRTRLEQLTVVGALAQLGESRRLALWCHSALDRGQRSGLRFRPGEAGMSGQVALGIEIPP